MARLKDKTLCGDEGENGGGYLVSVKEQVCLMVGWILAQSWRLQSPHGASFTTLADMLTMALFTESIIWSQRFMLQLHSG